MSEGLVILPLVKYFDESENFQRGSKFLSEGLVILSESLVILPLVIYFGKSENFQRGSKLLSEGLVILNFWRGWKFRARV